jgi:hypothetical protein
MNNAFENKEGVVIDLSSITLKGDTLIMTIEAYAIICMCLHRSQFLESHKCIRESNRYTRYSSKWEDKEIKDWNVRYIWK